MLRQRHRSAGASARPQSPLGQTHLIHELMDPLDSSGRRDRQVGHNGACAGLEHIWRLASLIPQSMSEWPSLP